MCADFLSSEQMRVIPRADESTSGVESNFDKFVLCGHSLGGYLSGLSLSPKIAPSRGQYNSNNSSSSRVINPFPHISGHYAAKYPTYISHLVLLSPAGLPQLPLAEDTIPARSLPVGMRLLDAAWNGNVTPGQIVRFSGPRGPGMVQRMISR